MDIRTIASQQISLGHSDDKYGQLGMGQKHKSKAYKLPKICQYNLLIKQVACGAKHSSFLTLRGHVYTIGSNENGRLGIRSSSIVHSSSPCLVESLAHSACRLIACGEAHTLAVLSSEGSSESNAQANFCTYAWGAGQSGQLGQGKFEDSWQPVRMQLEDQRLLNPEISAIACGAQHSLIVRQSGEVFATGLNENGQLGIGRLGRESVPSRVVVLEKITDVAAGRAHSLFLTQGGEVYAAGDNTCAQLGLGHRKRLAAPVKIAVFENVPNLKVKKIAAGGKHSAAVTQGGLLYVWGGGAGVPTAIAQGQNHQHPTPLLAAGGDRTIVDVALGEAFGVALDNRGYAYAWGANTQGELAQGDTEAQVQPRRVTALKNKVITHLRCGQNFVLALGENRDQQVLEGRRKRTEESELYSATTKAIYVHQDEDVDSESDGLGQQQNLQHYLNEEEKKLWNSTSPAVNGGNSSTLTAKLKTITEQSFNNSQSNTGLSSSEDGQDLAARRAHRRSASFNTQLLQRNTYQNEKNIQANFGRKTSFDDKNRASTLEAQLRAERAERAQQQHVLQDLTQQVQELQFGSGGFEDISLKLEEKVAQFETLQKQYERRKADIEILKRENEVLEATAAEGKLLAEKCASLEQELGVLREKVSSQRSELARCQKQSDTRSRHHEQELENLRKELKRACEERQSLFLELQRTSIAYNEIDERCSQQSARTQELQQVCDARGKEVEQLRAQKKQQKYKKKLQDTAVHIQEQTQNVREISAALDAKEALVNSQQREIAALQRLAAETQEKNEKLALILNQEIERQADEYKRQTLKFVRQSVPGDGSGNERKVLEVAIKNAAASFSQSSSAAVPASSIASSSSASSISCHDSESVHSQLQRVLSPKVQPEESSRAQDGGEQMSENSAGGSEDNPPTFSTEQRRVRMYRQQGTAGGDDFFVGSEREVNVKAFELSRNAGTGTEKDSAEKKSALTKQSNALKRSSSSEFKLHTQQPDSTPNSNQRETDKENTEHEVIHLSNFEDYDSKTNSGKLSNDTQQYLRAPAAAAALQQQPQQRATSNTPVQRSGACRSVSPSLRALSNQNHCTTALFAESGLLFEDSSILNCNSPSFRNMQFKSKTPFTNDLRHLDDVKQRLATMKKSKMALETKMNDFDKRLRQFSKSYNAATNAKK